MVSVLTVVVVGAAVAGCSDGDAGEEAAAAPSPVMSPAPVETPSAGPSPSVEPSQTSRTATLSAEQLQWVEAARPVVDDFYAAWSQETNNPTGDITAVRFRMFEFAGQEFALAIARGSASSAENGTRVIGSLVPTNVQVSDVYTEEVSSFTGEPTGYPTVLFEFCMDVTSQTVVLADGREVQPFRDGPDDPVPDRYPARVWVQDVGPAQTPGLPEGWVVTGGLDAQSESWTDPEVDPCART